MGQAGSQPSQPDGPPLEFVEGTRTVRASSSSHGRSRRSRVARASRGERAARSTAPPTDETATPTTEEQPTSNTTGIGVVETTKPPTIPIPPTMPTATPLSSPAMTDSDATLAHLTSLIAQTESAASAAVSAFQHDLATLRHQLETVVAASRQKQAEAALAQAQEQEFAALNDEEKMNLRVQQLLQQFARPLPPPDSAAMTTSKPTYVSQQTRQTSGEMRPATKRRRSRVGRDPKAPAARAPRANTSTPNHAEQPSDTSHSGLPPPEDSPANESAPHTHPSTSSSTPFPMPDFPAVDTHVPGLFESDVYQEWSTGSPPLTGLTSTRTLHDHVDPIPPLGSDAEFHSSTGWPNAEPFSLHHRVDLPSSESHLGVDGADPWTVGGETQLTPVSPNDANSDDGSYPRSIRASDRSKHLLSMYLSTGAMQQLKVDHESGRFSALAIRQRLAFMMNSLEPDDHSALIEQFGGMSVQQKQDSPNDSGGEVQAPEYPDDSDIRSSRPSLDLFSLAHKLDLGLSPLEAAPDDIDGVARMRLSFLVPQTQQRVNKRKSRHEDDDDDDASGSSASQSEATHADEERADWPSPSTYLLMHVNRANERLTGFTQSHMVQAIRDANSNMWASLDIVLRRDFIPAAYQISFDRSMIKQTEGVMFQVRLRADGSEFYALVHHRVSLMDGGSFMQIVESVMPLPADESHPLPPYVAGVDQTVETLLHGYRPVIASSESAEARRG